MAAEPTAAACSPSSSGRSGCSNTKFKPPIIYKVSLGIMGLGKLFLWPENAPIVSPSSSGPIPTTLFVGIPMFVCGSLFALQAKKMFKQTNTPIMGGPSPGQKSPVLHTEGVFSITRNPMYLGISFALVGAAVATNCWWHMVFPIINVMVMNAYFIPIEEQQMENVFGRTYVKYKQEVPRWL